MSVRMAGRGIAGLLVALISALVVLAGAAPAAVRTPARISEVPTVPAAPVVEAAPGNASATLTITPGDDGGSPVTGWEVSADGGSTWTAFAPDPAGDDLTTTVTGLTNYWSAYVMVHAINAIGTGADAGASVTPQPDLPGAPGSLTIEPEDSGALLRFTPPGDDGGSEIFSYEMATDGGDWQGVAQEPTGDGNGTLRARVYGLVNGTTYAVQLRAVNSRGGGAAISAQVTPAAVPSEPTSVTVEPRDRSAYWEFAPPDSDGGAAVDHYEVSVDDGDWVRATVSPAEVDGRWQLTTSGLTNGVTYLLRLRAVNSRGPGRDYAEYVKPMTLPGAPTALVATAALGGAYLAFEPPADHGGPGVSWYDYSVDDGGTWQRLTAGPTEDDPATWMGYMPELTARVAYRVRLRAINEVGPGPASDAVTVAPIGTPDAPTGLAVTVHEDATATLVFTPPADTGGSEITWYDVSTGEEDTWYQLPTTPTGGDATTVQGTVDWITRGESYTFRVRAVNMAGDGAASEPRTVTLKWRPGAPASLYAEPGNQVARLFFWPPDDDGADPITSYEVSVDGGDTWTTLDLVTDHDVEDLTGTVTGLANDVEVTVLLRAVNATGAGEPASVTVTPTAVPVTPSPSESPSEPPPAWPSPQPEPVVTTPSPLPSPSPTTASPSPSPTSPSPSPSVTATSASPSPSAAGPSASPSRSAASPSASPSVPPSALPSPGPSTSPPAPAAPGGVTAQAGISSIIVSWVPPADAGGIARYRAEARPGPGSCTSSGTTCVIGAEAGTSYTVTVVALGRGGTSAPSAASNAVTPTTPRVPDTVPATDKKLESPAGAGSTVAPGGTVTIRGAGYAPFSTVTVTLYSDPLDLGTATADAAGEISLTVTLPDGVPAGTHSIVASGVDKNGNALVRRLDVRAAATTTDPATPSLPVTGPAVLWLLAAGAASTLTGAVARLLATRR